MHASALTYLVCIAFEDPDSAGEQIGFHDHSGAPVAPDWLWDCHPAAANPSLQACRPADR